MRIVADRLALARALGSAGFLVVGGLALLLVIGACAPVGVALALGTLVGHIGQTGAGMLDGAVTPLLAFAGIVLLGHVVDALAKPLEFQAKALIDGKHRSGIIRLATAADGISHLEDAQVRRIITQVSAESDYGIPTPADGAIAQLRWLAGLVGTAAVCAVLARYAWWTVPLVLAFALTGLFLRARQYFKAVSSLRTALREELHADVWREAAASSAEGKDVRIFGFAGWMIDRMQRHIADANGPFWRSIEAIARQSWLQCALVLCALVPVCAMVSGSAAAGSTPVSEQTAILVAAWGVFASVGSGTVIFQMAGSAEALRAVGELQEILEPGQRVGPARSPALASLPALESGPSSPPAAQTPPPAVRFERVRFRYPGTDRYVLDGVDLEIAPGKMLAVVGLNGAGKSTLMKLLAGLYEPSSGCITVDGRPVAEYGIARWRRQLTVVFQDFIRYQVSARDNVTLGRGDVPADADAASVAAAQSGLTTVLDRLPGGWDTPLSHNRAGGVDLSGGQWQQVVLARALYAVRKGTRVLVLDEPTAHVDVRTEFEIFQRLAAHRGQISVVLISHRLSTVRQADKIVLLAGGQVTESGTHDELMAADGTYARLFRIQAERFQDDKAEEEEGQ